MSGGKTFLIAFVTAALTSAVTTVAVVRFLGRDAPTPPAQVQSVKPEQPPPPPRSPATVEVPSLKGLSPDQARLLLKDRGLLLVLDREEPAPGVEKGLVAQQMPLAASTVRDGSEVHAVVSAGRPPISVPGLAGKSEAEATAALASAGLKVAGVVRKPDTAPAGTVLSTDPAAGATLQDGGSVAVTVSAGPDLVEVPRVTGGGASKARKLLEGAKLAPGKTHFVYNEDYSPGIVFRQVPAAGEKVAPGTPVDLYVVEE